MTYGKIYIGIDPDLQTPAIAAVHEEGYVVGVACGKKHPHRKQKAIEHLAKTSDKLLFDFLQWIGYDGSTAEAYCVEAQRVYVGRTKNPQSIVLLAAAAGVMLGVCRGHVSPSAGIMFPLPEDWKSNVPKRIHQARMYKRLGVQFEVRGGAKERYCVPREGSWPRGVPPLGAEELNQGDWKHVGDAIGLALYALDKSRS